MSFSARMAPSSSTSTLVWWSPATPGVPVWTWSTPCSMWRSTGHPFHSLSVGSVWPPISYFSQCSALPSRRRARLGVLRELCEAAAHRASYEGSVEELTPVRHDLRAALPVTAAALATLAWPRSWRFFSSGAVANYALSPGGWKTIVSTQTEPP